MLITLGKVTSSNPKPPNIKFTFHWDKKLQIQFEQIGTIFYKTYFYLIWQVKIILSVFFIFWANFWVFSKVRKFIYIPINQPFLSHTEFSRLMLHSCPISVSVIMSFQLENIVQHPGHNFNWENLFFCNLNENWATFMMIRWFLGFDLATFFDIFSENWLTLLSEELAIGFLMIDT